MKITDKVELGKKKSVIGAAEMKGFAPLKVEGEIEKHDLDRSKIDPQYARKMSCTGNYN